MALTAGQLVLQAIQEAGPIGLTDDEISLTTGLLPDTVRPRRMELYMRGLVDEANMTRLTRRGRKAQVWVTAPVPSGYVQ